MKKKRKKQKPAPSSPGNSPASESESRNRPASAGPPTIQEPPPTTPLAAVQSWILDGQTLEHVRDAVRQIYPDADPETLIKDTMRAFVDVAREPDEAIRGWCMAATRHLYRQMNSVGDFVGALRAVQVLDRLATRSRVRGTAPKDLDI
jgi:hypothetical protein